MCSVQCSQLPAQSLHKYQGTENKALKTALRKRDTELETLRQKVGQLEQAQAQAGIRQLERTQTLKGALSAAGW